MNLPANHNSSAESLLGTVSLEVLRNKALRNIEEDASLSVQQKLMAIKELDFLLEYERLRRLRNSAYQWEEERREHRYRMAQRHQEMTIKLAIERKETVLRIAEINRDITACKLRIIEDFKKLKPKDESLNHVRQLKKDLSRLQLQKRIAQAHENSFHQNLTERVANRARFIKQVRREYPDLAEELVDFYDQQVFRQEGRK